MLLLLGSVQDEIVVHAKLYGSADNRVVEMKVPEQKLVQDSVRGSWTAAENEGRHFEANHTSETELTNLDVVVDLQHVLSTTGPKFVGVTIDASFFRQEWKRFDVYNKTLQNLARGLAPSFIRVGGSAADFLIFNATPGVQKHTEGDENYLPLMPAVEKPKEKNFTVTGTDWERLNYFVNAGGWDLIFDFNELLRTDGHWDPDNAKELLQFSQQRNYSIPYFQLGNEPNSYYHDFHFTIPGSLLASDMKRLRSLIAEFPMYVNSSIIGPDVTKVTKDSAKDYLQEFLTSGGEDVVSVVTLHHYYFNAEGHTVKLSDFYNTSILDTLIEELAIGTSVVRSLAPQHTVWLSETSSISGGGLPGESDGYVAGFMWLDKLGLSALYGLKAVLRQSFAQGNYGLISDSNFFPYPDYFLTVLYKRLVQGPVFNVTTSTEKVRVYASCANPAYYQRGALTIYVLNIAAEATSVNLVQFANQSCDVYLLTPGDESGLKSPYVALNGDKLVLVDQDLPHMTPSVQKGPITFPAYSFGFIVIPQAGVDTCK